MGAAHEALQESRGLRRDEHGVPPRPLLRLDRRQEAGHPAFQRRKRRDESVQKLIDGVLKTLRRSEDSKGFLFFTTEHRAIGELMCSWEVAFETGLRTPHVMGYATFQDRFANDPEFSKWFSPVHDGMTLVSKGDVRRLVDIQRALVDLIDELDPKRKYTAGYTPEPIEPEESGGVTDT